jgi:hypothetical protein
MEGDTYEFLDFCLRTSCAGIKEYPMSANLVSLVSQVLTPDMIGRKEHKAKLVVAKLDGLARNVRFLLTPYAL